jgi:hypothetical protein
MRCMYSNGLTQILYLAVTALYRIYTFISLRITIWRQGFSSLKQSFCYDLLWLTGWWESYDKYLSVCYNHVCPWQHRKIFVNDKYLSVLLWTNMIIAKRLFHCWVTEIRYSCYAADQKRQQLNKARQIGYFINTMIHRVDTCAVRD